MPFYDDHFENFVGNWQSYRQRLVIFLGAGASVGAVNASGNDLPNAYQLRNQLWRRFKTSGQPFDPAELGLMSLEHAAAIIETNAGRKDLNDELVATFTCHKPLWQHIALPYLRPKSIFTTNYDEMIELGYKQQIEVPDIICDDRVVNSNRVALYKPHGSLGNSHLPVGAGGLVITQFDYFEMISRYRKMLNKSMSGFDESCVIIAGYSFGDMDIGSELYSIRQRNKGTNWYAIFPRNDPQVRQMYSDRLGIRQIATTLEGFLRELDARVNFIDSKHKFGRKGHLCRAGIIQ